MKVQAVKDARGKVVATYEMASGQDAVSVAPMLPAGHKVEEMEVAEDYRTNLKAFYEKNG